MNEKADRQAATRMAWAKVAVLFVICVIGATAAISATSPSWKTLALGGIASGFLAVSGAFKRIQAKRVLENPVRREIVRVLRRQDGEHLTAIAEALGVTRQTVSYHADVLSSFDLIRLVKDGPYMRAFLRRDARKGTAILRRSWAAKIVALLAAKPDMPVKELAERTGVTVPTARWYLRKLEEADVLESNAGHSKRAPTLALWAERDVAVQPSAYVS